MKNNSQRSRIALLLIYFILVIEVLYLIVNCWYMVILQNIINNVPMNDSGIDYCELSIAFLTILHAIALLISAVTFIKWFRRAYYNLDTQIETRFEDVWCVWSWFAPIINIFRPYQIMKELYVETNELLVEDIGTYTPSNTAYVILWWILWVVTLVVGNISYEWEAKAQTAEHILMSTQLDIFSTALWICLSILTIKVIGDYAKMEQLLYQMNIKAEEN